MPNVSKCLRIRHRGSLNDRRQGLGVAWVWVLRRLSRRVWGAGDDVCTIAPSSAAVRAAAWRTGTCNRVGVRVAIGTPGSVGWRPPRELKSAVPH